jgi:coniferyl-aldehyde dehydrogenase
VAPDYALVPQESIQEFVIECKKNFIAMFGGNISKNLTIRRLSMIVIKKEFKRYWQTLKKSAQIIECSAYDVEKDGRRMPVHIVLNCSPQMRIMKEELFGPVLPVVSYDTLDEAIKYIKADERPLALYCFSHSSSELDAILKQTHSGGVTINDWGWHVVNHDAPFGGIVIQVWAHIMAKKVSVSYHMPKQCFHDIGSSNTTFYAPYGSWIQKQTMKFFLKKGDPTL